MVFPSLIDGSVFASYKQSDLVSIECSLQVRESINGLKERRGPTELSYNYPLSQEYGFYFDQQFFTRNYFTTGVVITHPVLNKERVECLSLAELIYETFLLKIPFERQDINFAVDKFRVNRKPVVQQGSRFIALYDQTYGSLRLSGRLMEPGILNQTLREARALADTQETLILNSETLAALDTLVEATAYKQASISFGSDVAGTAQADSSTRVILADSKGLIASRCEEFLVKRTFFAPDGLSYEGQTLSQIGKHETTIMLVQMVLEIPGVSKIGYYNYRTGQVEEAEESDAVQGIKPPEFVWKSLTPDLEKLVSIISSYFDENKIRSLCNETGVDYDSLAGGDKSERTRELIVHCDSLGLVATFAQRALTVLKQR
jgi:DEAD/DEAH box helicase domain-containing protein